MSEERVNKSYAVPSITACFRDDGMVCTVEGKVTVVFGEGEMNGGAPVIKIDHFSLPKPYEPEPYNETVVNDHTTTWDFLQEVDCGKDYTVNMSIDVMKSTTVIAPGFVVGPCP